MWASMNSAVSEGFRTEADQNSRQMWVMGMDGINLLGPAPLDPGTASTDVEVLVSKGRTFELPGVMNYGLSP